MVNTGPTHMTCRKCGRTLPKARFLIPRAGGFMLAICNCSDCYVPCRRIDRLRRLANNQSQRAKKMGLPDTLTIEDVDKIFTEAAGRCGYCGVKVGEKNLTLDHRKPMMFGGGNVAESVVAACWPCNRKRQTECGAMTIYRSSD